MPQPVGVLHLIWSLMRGGAERQAVEIARGLHGNKYRVTVGCLTEGGPLEEDLAEAGIEIIKFDKKPGLDINLPLRIARVMRERKICLLHAHMFTAALWGRLAWVFGGRPKIICHEHSTHTLDNSRRVMIDKTLLPLTDCTVVVSSDLGDKFASRGYPAAKLLTIRNGVRLDAFDNALSKEEARASLGLDGSAPLVLIVGMLEPRKDHAALFSAFKLFVENRNDAKLLVVGDGPLKDELKKLAADLGIADSIMFMGERKDVPALLAASDVYVSSSITEGTSIAMLEAMAAGTPIVATNVGGTPEVLDGGECGLLCPPKDPALLADALGEVFSDPSAAAARAQSARERVYDEYALTTMLEKFDALYEELLGLREGV